MESDTGRLVGVNSSDAIFLAIALPAILAFTAWRIWVMRKASRLYRELHRMLDEAERSGQDHDHD